MNLLCIFAVKQITNMKKHNRFTSHVRAILTSGVIALVALSVNSQTVRENIRIDDGWHFSLEPQVGSPIKAFETTVDLPHDWSTHLPFDRNAPSGNDGGYVSGGKGTYKRTIDIDENGTEGNRYFLLFEGVYERWTLKVNGDSIGFQPYGYSSVIYDITPNLKGGINEIEVNVDNTNQPNCRWYTGSGIYRHVNLIKTSDLLVSPWSLYITTPNVSDKEAAVSASLDIEGYDPTKDTRCVVSVTDSNGATVAKKEVKVTDSNVNTTLTVSNPELWSVESPTLYTMKVELLRDGKPTDVVENSFGIRTIEVSAEEGLKLNGKSIELNGACVHHDHGILGAAAYDAAEARKVRQLKEAGFNAVRTSHNPPSPAFLDECDRQGLLVMDEAFDGWRDSKTPHDYAGSFDEWAIKDVGAMVRRDRNHPSIMAWSIGNEVIERKKIEVVTTARKLANECRRLDPTRPVTEALCAWDADWEIYDPHAEELDIVGYNYMIHKSESDHARDPKRIMWQTESYPAAAAWSWHKVTEHPYIIGDFVWTGIDYLGESGIGRNYYVGQTEGEHYHRPQWPWHGAYCGDVDLTGFRKPISHYRSLLYNGDEKLYMAVREPNGYNGEIKTTQWSVWPTWESWNWEGHEGKDIEVEVASRYPLVKLYINDQPVGESSVGAQNDYKALMKVAYQPGKLKVEGCDADGTVREIRTLTTAGKPAAVRLTTDKTALSSDNQDIAFVVAEIVDKDGNVVPDAECELSFSVTGPASVVASGNADLSSTAQYDTPETKAWKGRAIAAVKSSHKPGTIKVTAKSAGLRGSTLKLNSSNR